MGSTTKAAVQLVRVSDECGGRWFTVVIHKEIKSQTISGDYSFELIFYFPI